MEITSACSAETVGTNGRYWYALLYRGTTPQPGVTIMRITKCVLSDTVNPEDFWKAEVSFNFYVQLTLICKLNECWSRWVRVIGGWAIVVSKGLTGLKPSGPAGTTSPSFVFAEALLPLPFSRCAHLGSFPTSTFVLRFCIMSYVNNINIGQNVRQFQNCHNYILSVTYIICNFYLCNRPIAWWRQKPKQARHALHCGINRGGLLSDNTVIIPPF